MNTSSLCVVCLGVVWPHSISVRSFGTYFDLFHPFVLNMFQGIKCEHFSNVNIRSRLLKLQRTSQDEIIIYQVQMVLWQTEFSFCSSPTCQCSDSSGIFGTGCLEVFKPHTVHMLFFFAGTLMFQFWKRGSRLSLIDSWTMETGLRKTSAACSTSPAPSATPAIATPSLSGPWVALLASTLTASWLGWCQWLTLLSSSRTVNVICWQCKP